MAKRTQVVDVSQVEISDEPPSWKWVLGVGFAVLLGVALYGVDLFGTSLYFLDLHKNFKERLSSTESMADLLAQAEFKPLIEGKNKELDILLGIEKFLEKSEYDRAITWSKNPAIKNVAGLTELTLALEKLKALSTKTPEAGNSVASAELEYRGLQSQYAVLTSRLAKALGQEALAESWQERAASIAEDANSEFEVAFYESGVLAGLPVIEGLPDALSDYPEIADHLPSQTQRSFQRSLGWSGSGLRRELATLLTDANTLTPMLTLSSEQLAMAKQAVEDSKSEITLTESQAREARDQILAQLTKPQLSEHARMVYAFVKDKSQGVFEGLPEISS